MHGGTVIASFPEAMSLEKKIRQGFERLQPGDLTVTSDTTEKYNCIAWAVGDHTNWWWPSHGYYWPEGVERSITIEAFTAAFSTVGFKPCADGKHADGVEKLALFTKNGKPTHASFSLPNGKWASKLGRDHDIEHLSVEGIGGAEYGDPTHFFCRKTPDPPRPKMPNLMAEFAAKYGAVNNAPKKRPLGKKHAGPGKRRTPT